MRILVISNLFPPHHIGGYELRCADVVNGLRERGHVVQVLTSTYGLMKPQDEGFVFRRLKLNGFPGDTWHPIWTLAAIQLYNIRTFRWVCQSFQPDLLFLWNMNGFTQVIPVTAKKIGVPVVFDISDESLCHLVKGCDSWVSWWNIPNQRLRSKVLRRVFENLGIRKMAGNFLPVHPAPIKLDHAYFTSRDLRNHYKDQGVPVEGAPVIYCGIPLRRIAERKVPLPFPPFRLLFVGRVVPEKGVETAIRALSILIQRRGQGSVCLTVVGPRAPEYIQKLSQLGEKEGSTGSVQFTGPLVREKVGDFYQSHHALVFPSIWDEPFALTPLEAMASCLPVIGAPTGGSKELFIHGVNSLTFKAGDPIDLADRVEALMDDPALLSCLAREGRHLVSQQFSVEKMVSEIESYLQEVLQRWEGNSKTVRRPSARMNVSGTQVASKRMAKPALPGGI